MRYLNLSFLMAAAAITHAGTMAAQPANWFEMGSPSARCCMGMAYDDATKSTVLFGGDNSGQIYGDTWTWRAGWHPTSRGTSPSARSGPAMAYDGAAGNIVLFGGVNSAGTALNDTWTWDGNNWTQQFPAASPPGRQFDLQGMAYDAATQTVVLLGGSTAALMLWATHGPGMARQRPGSNNFLPPVHRRDGLRLRTTMLRGR